MNSNNVVSITLGEDKVARINKAFLDFLMELRPDLAALSPKQKQSLPKMGDGSYAFVQKANDYCITNAEFAPVFLDLTEMHKDADVIRFLTPLLQSITALQSDLEDTIIIASSEAFSAARTYYNSVTYAAANGNLSAKPIAEDLSQRYPGRTKKAKTDKNKPQ
jgi:hypothetical protein